MPARTATELIAAVKRRAWWPASNAPFTDAEILLFADEEIQGPIYQAILESHSEVYESTSDTSLVSGVATYRLPNEIAMQVRDVLLVDAAGEEWQLERLAKDRLGYLDTVTKGRPSAFVLDGHRVRLWPTPSSAMTLRFKHRWLPADLTETGTTIVWGEGLDLASDPSGWSALGATTFAVMADHGAHNVIWKFSSSWSGSAFGAITDVYRTHGANYTAYGASDPRTEPRDGDFIAVDGTTHVPQIPTEAYPLLVTRTLLSCLHAHRDPRAESRLILMRQEREEERFREYLDNRVDGEGETHINDGSALGFM